MSQLRIGRLMSHLLSRLVVTSLSLVAATSFVAISSAAQTDTQLYSAGAYGTYAYVGSVVETAKTAPVGVGPGCGTPKVGASDTATVATVNAAPIVTTGAINTSASSALNTATATSDIHNIAVLSGLITAEEITAVSTTTNNNGTLQSSEAGSSLVNLVVAGTLISALPEPNTTIDLAGFGKVVLNEEIMSSHASKAKLTVNLIHVYITQANVLDIKIGSQIILASAHSGLAEASGPAILDGTAFGTSVSSKLLRSSPTAEVGVGCEGDELKTKTQAGVTVTGVLTSGTITDTAEGTVKPSEAMSQTSSTVQSVNLLGGLITADTIQGQASGSTTDGTTFNFNGTGSFVNISVSGHPEITDNVAQNTEVELSGIGTLYLYRVLPAATKIEVRMIEVKLAPNNILGLPTGLDVKISDSEASLHSTSHP
jgi:hypothetical protein